jgi:hypothetical protein
LAAAHEEPGPKTVYVGVMIVFALFSPTGEIRGEKTFMK